MFTLRSALTKVWDTSGENGNYAIIPYSWHTLKALKLETGFPFVADEIKTTIHCAKAKNPRINFCRVSGHVGIGGTERQMLLYMRLHLWDQPNSQQTDTPYQLEKTNPRHYKKRMAERMALHRLRKLGVTRSNISKGKASCNKYRRIQTVLTCLRIARINIINSYLMLGQTNPPKCECCRKHLTVKHIMVEYKKLATFATSIITILPC